MSDILPFARWLLLSGATSAILSVGVTLGGFASATAGNRVKNPSFEEFDAKGNPVGWAWWGSEAGKTAAGEFFECEPEGRTGDWSISIRQEGWGSRGYWYTVLDGIEPQRWYAVSLWAKRDRPTGWVPEIELFGQRRVMNLRPADVWQRFDWLLHSGETSGRAILKLVNSRKPYKVWFDDVVVEEVMVEPVSSMESRTEGQMLSWRSPSTSRLVVFEVEIARTSFFDTGLRSLGRTLKEEISLPEKLSSGEWFWRVKAFHTDSLLAVSPPQRISVATAEAALQLPSIQKEFLPPLYPGSSQVVSFDGSQNMVVEGEGFFPVGIYSLPPELFREGRQAGFNVVLTDEIEAARHAGLRAMVYRGFREEGGTSSSSPGRMSHGHDPHAASAGRGIIARYLWDEPAQMNVSPEEVFEAHVREKEIDPHHPTAIVVYRPESFGDYASASDILMTDPYPIPHRPLTVVSESVRAARKAVGDRKPVWAIIQAFNWAESSQEARRIGWARWPTYAEQRCMAYLAAINGAKGILFFRYGGSEHDPNNWRAVKRVAAELRTISPLLLSETVSWPVSVAVESPSGERDVSSRIEYVFKARGGSTYLIGANNWPGKRRVTFSFDKALRNSLNLPFERRRVQAAEQSFSDIFEPYGVHIYELSFR